MERFAGDGPANAALLERMYRDWPFFRNLVDNAQLELARAHRFEPLRAGDRQQLLHPLNNLAWGRLIFDWQTVPPPATP